MIELTLIAYLQLWLIHPTDPIATAQGERSPRAEYISTLTKHSGAVNVVRWSPNGTCPSYPTIFRCSVSKSCWLTFVRALTGELLASGADDGMLIIWTRDDKPQGSVWGRDPKEAALDKETWRVLNAIRLVHCTLSCLPYFSTSPLGQFHHESTNILARVTSGEVYDIAWSPTGEYILTGSTDNTARIFSIADNVCVREIADHNHYVQGL
jgi:chromatin assembly factor 1 subunit B